MYFKETSFKVTKSIIDLKIFFNVLYFKKINFKFTLQLSNPLFMG